MMQMTKVVLVPESHSYMAVEAAQTALAFSDQAFTLYNKYSEKVGPLTDGLKIVYEKSAEAAQIAIQAANDALSCCDHEVLNNLVALAQREADIAMYNRSLGYNMITIASKRYGIQMKLSAIDAIKAEILKSEVEIEYGEEQIQVITQCMSEAENTVDTISGQIMKLCALSLSGEPSETSGQSEPSEKSEIGSPDNQSVEKSDIGSPDNQSDIGSLETVESVLPENLDIEVKKPSFLKSVKQSNQMYNQKRKGNRRNSQEPTRFRNRNEMADYIQNSFERRGYNVVRVVV